ncbi:fibronectin-like [Lytechinus variegatus]|uniref:fibronectin-like n=1 Tax=Lytechinus variegatus TaxID=7654 RepID=UPI001BB1BCE1|nr:fibronectin-like [Lytechinus variegatus]
MDSRISIFLVFCLVSLAIAQTPGQVRSLAISDIQQWGFSASWQEPLDGNTPVRYNVTIESTNPVREAYEMSFEPASNGVYEVDHLYDSSTYSFSVVAVNSDGQAGEAVVESNIVIPPCRICLDTAGINYFSFIFEPTFSEDSYLVGRSVDATSETEYPPRNLAGGLSSLFYFQLSSPLIPGVLYEFEVRRDSDDVLLAASRYRTTPYPVTNLQVGITGLSVTIEYEQPTQIRENSFGYRISYNDAQGNPLEQLVATEDTSVEIIDLEVGVLYSFEVQSYSGEFGDRTYSTIESQDISIVALTIQEQGTTSLTVGWTQTVGEVSRLDVFGIFGGSNSTLAQDLFPDATVATIGSLSPGEVYRVTLFISNANGGEDVVASEVFQTTPEMVTNIVGVIMDTSISLTWNSAAGRADYYLVSYDPPYGSTNMLSEVVGNTFQIEGLDPGIQYDVGIVTAAGDGRSAQAVEMFMTAVGDPDMILLKEITATSFAVTWSPRVGASSYTISISPDAGNPPFTFVSGERLFAEFTGLSEGTVYTVTLAIDSIPPVNPLEGEFKTNPSIPGTISITNLLPRSATLSWGASAGADEYAVAVSLGEDVIFEMQVPALSVDIMDLEPETTYSVVVVAESVQQGFISRSGEQTTSFETAPAVVSLGAVTTTSVLILQTSPTYVIEYTSGDGQILTVTPGDGDQTDLTGLTPGQEYTITIKQESVTTDQLTFFTKPMVPGEFNLTLGDPATSSFSMMYSAPTAGLYDGYTISYSGASVGADGRESSPIVVDSSSTEKTITGLTPGTVYTASINSFVNGGNTISGFATQTITTETGGDASFYVFSKTTDTLIIKFAPIGTSYSAVATERNGQGPVPTVEEAVGKFTFSGLRPGSVYSIMLRVTRAGQSSLESLQDVQTLPSTPTSVVAVPSESSPTITVTWQPGAGEVTSYRLQLAPTGGGDATSVLVLASLEPRYVFEGVLPSTGYDVSVTAIARDMLLKEESYPETVQVTTPPRRFSISSVTTTGFVLTLDGLQGVFSYQLYDGVGTPISIDPGDLPYTATGYTPGALLRLELNAIIVGDQGAVIETIGVQYVLLRVKDAKRAQVIYVKNANVRGIRLGRHRVVSGGTVTSGSCVAIISGLRQSGFRLHGNLQNIYSISFPFLLTEPAQVSSFDLEQTSDTITISNIVLGAGEADIILIEYGSQGRDYILPSETEKKIEFLEPGVTYTVTLSTEVHARGLSQKSDPRQQSIVTSSVPLGVPVVDEFTTHSITIRWNRQSPYTHRIYIQEKYSDTILAEASYPNSDPVTSHTFDVQPATLYEVTIEIIDSADVVRATNSKDVRSLPEAVAYAQITSVSPTSISLLWDIPDGATSDGFELRVIPPPTPGNYPIVVTEQSYVIESLRPGTVYDIQVVSLSGQADNCQTFGTPFQIVTTTEFLGDLEIVAVNILDTEASLQFTANNFESTGVQFRITYTPTDGSAASETIAVTEGIYIVEVIDLLGGTSYDVELAVIRSDTQSVEATTTTTFVTLPRAPVSISEVSKGFFSFTVMLEPPTDNYDGVVITANGESKEILAGAADFQVTFENLVPGETYTVDAYSFLSSPELTSLPLMDFIPVSITTDTPDPGEITVQSFSMTSITVSWGAVPNVDQYLVTLDPSEGVRTENIMNRRVDFTDLTPGRMYNITLISESPSEPDITSSIIQNTVPFPPSSLVVEDLDVSNTIGFRLSWQLPTQGEWNGFRITYTPLNGESQDKVVGMSVTSTTLEGLFQETQYTLVLTSVTGQDDTVQDSEAVSEVAQSRRLPDNTMIINLIDESTVFFTWTIWEGSSTLDIYNEEFALVASDLVPNSRWEENGLSPASVYRISVTRFDGGLIFDQSITREFRTAPLRPSAIEVLEDESNDKEITISWTPTSGSEFYLPTLVHPDGSEVSHPAVSAYVPLLATFTGLDNGTNYRLAVASGLYQFDQYPELLSPAVMIEHTTDALGQEGPTLPPSPSTVVATTGSADTSVQIFWSTPQASDNIYRYKIVYVPSSDGGEAASLADPADGTSEIFNLIPAVPYTFFLSSVVQNLENNTFLESEPVNATYTIDPTPGEVYVLTKTNSSITFIWTQVGQPSFFALILTSNGEQIGNEVTVSGSYRPSYTFEGLQSSTEYTVTVDHHTQFQTQTGSSLEASYNATATTNALYSRVDNISLLLQTQINLDLSVSSPKSEYPSSSVLQNPLFQQVLIAT